MKNIIHPDKIRIFVNFYIYSAVIIFLLTGAAKLTSSFGAERILSTLDPIFGITFKHLLLMAGFIELGLAVFLVFSTNAMHKTIMVCYTATAIAIYRVGLWVVLWHHPCSCMGTLTDRLHISPQIADQIMKVILVYLVVGGYASWIWLVKCGKKASAPHASMSVPSY